MLAYKPYVLKCILGAEIVYVLCMLYRNFVTVEFLPLHDSLFGLLPGFSWTGAGIVSAGIGIAIYAAIFGTYMVWMHNSSMNSTNK